MRVINNNNAASDGFVCIKSNAVSKAPSYVGNVFELSGVAFRLAPPYGGLLVFIMLDVLAAWKR